MTACLDWEQRLINKQSIIPPPLYEDAAENALRVFKALRVPDMINKPTFGEVAAPWVFDFVKAIFGGYDTETGQQEISEFMLLISKKNGKSTVAAGIMLTALILCWREEEEHLILAPTTEGARMAFDPAAGMVRADEELEAMFIVQDYIRTITHRVNKNSLKIVAADSKSATGKKAGRVLIDELHEFGKMSKSANVFREATGGLAARPEGFVIYLTTQSEEPPQGVFKSKLNYFRDVRDGAITDNRSLPILYEYPPRYLEEKLYLKPENFHITNPNLDYSVSQDWLIRNLEKAQKDTEAEALQIFLSKHLNVEIGLALRNDRWAAADFWEQAEDASVTLASLLDRCEVVTVGIDGGGLDDLLGLYVLGRETDSSNWLGWGKAWVNPIAIERRQENKTKYLDFQTEGDLVIAPNVGDDADHVAQIVADIYETGLLYQVGCDPAGIGDILDRLEAQGLPEDKIVGVSQGWRLGGAIQTAERRLASKRLTPAKQNLMRWCISNARVEDRANGILITKSASGKGKIDPVMSMLNAVFLMMSNPPAQYDTLVLASASRSVVY